MNEKGKERGISEKRRKQERTLKKKKTEKDGRGAAGREQKHFVLNGSQESELSSDFQRDAEPD